MFSKFLARKLFYSLLTFFCVGVLSFTTQTALELLVMGLEFCIPGRLAIESIEGNLLNGFTAHKLRYEHQPYAFNAQKVHVTLDFSALRDFQLVAPLLHGEEITVTSSDCPLLDLHTIVALLKINLFTQDKNFTIRQVEGVFQNQILTGFSSFLIKKDRFYLENTHLRLGSQSFIFKQKDMHNPYLWALNYKYSDKNSSYLNATVAYSLPATTGLQGVVQTGEASDNINQWFLKNPVPFELSVNNFTISKMLWQTNPLMGASLFLDVKVDHNALSTQFTAHHVGLNLLQTVLPENIDLQGLVNIDLAVKQPFDGLLEGHGTVDMLQSTLIQNDNKKNGTFIFKEGGVSFLTINDKIKVDMDIQGPFKSKALGSAFIQNANFLQAFPPLTLQGNIKFIAEDLSLVNTLIDEINDFKSHIHANIALQGTVQNPFIKTQAYLENTTFSLPKEGLKISNFNLQLKTNDTGVLTLEGGGISGKGTFTLHGSSELFKKNIPTKFTIKGDNVLIFNTKAYQITANPNLNFEYNMDNELTISGQINVPQANINLDEDKTHTAFSEDIIFVDSKAPVALTKKAWTIKPNIYLRFENNVIFQGNNLQALIGGKIQIEDYKNGFLYGSGRLTLKSGEYRLNGQKLYIHHGRLLFQPASLLSNPTLDIRLIPKPKGLANTNDNNQLGLYVQGTLKDPSIHPFSNQELTETEILQRLGFANPFTVLLGNMNVGTSVMESLQNNLGLDEISLQTNPGEQGSFANQAIMQPYNSNTSIINIGKRLSNRLLLQLQQAVVPQGFNEAPTKLRLKYFIGSNWSLAGELNSEGGGADITYSTEKD